MEGASGSKAVKRDAKSSGSADGSRAYKKKKSVVDQSDFLQLKPTEIDIRAHVCQKDGDKWPVVCKYLGVPPAKVQMARSNNPNQEEDACFEAVMHWRSGNTSVAVSWVGLLEALKRGDLGDVADSIAVQNGVEPVEVNPALPKSLQHARGLVYHSYQRPSFTEGRKVHFTRVAVLQKAPTPRKRGDLDQGEFLKRYRDCGVQLSEGETEQVTVTHFLHKEPHQTRIIYGQPGTGKTTFLKHLCQEVANNEPSDFSLILFFPMRGKAVSQALKSSSTPYEVGLVSILQYYISDQTCSAIARELLQCKGKDVLIIFDGLDEISGFMDSLEGSLLGAMLEGRLLPQAHLILSTRPGGCPLLQEHSTSFYEILGFDEEAVESYVKDFFVSEPGKGESMVSDLRARPDLWGGAYVPMNLLIFCSIYERGVAGRSVFPPTMTECYKSSIAKTVTRDKQKVKKTSRVDPSLTNLAPDVEQLLLNLGELAFRGISETPPDYIFQEDEVRHVFHATIRRDETLDDSSFGGLLHLHPDQDGFPSTLNFSHTTKQEFFAAYCLSLLPKAKQAAFWRENCHNPKFAVVLKFFAGLTRFLSAEVNEAILAPVSDLPSECDNSNPHLFLVFHTLYESQNESLTHSIVTQLNSCLTFDLYLTPFDTMVFSHCLTKCKHLNELHLLHPVHPTSFQHVCSVVQSNPLQSLTLRLDQFSTENASMLCQAAGPLKKLKLVVEQICPSVALANVFDHEPLEELLLIPFSNVVLGDSDVLKEKIAHCHLRVLQLIGDSNQLLPILSGVKDNCSITDLVIEDVTLNDRTPSAVAACAQTMPQLATLTIRRVNPLPVFQGLAHRDSSLHSVEVWRPQWGRFSEEDWAQLEEAATYAHVIKVKVDVWYCDRASRVLASGLSKNSLLRKVELQSVPKELVESVRRTLCTDTSTLTVREILLF